MQKEEKQVLVAQLYNDIKFANFNAKSNVIKRGPAFLLLKIFV